MICKDRAAARHSACRRAGLQQFFETPVIALEQGEGIVSATPRQPLGEAAVVRPSARPIAPAAAFIADDPDREGRFGCTSIDVARGLPRDFAGDAVVAVAAPAGFVRCAPLDFAGCVVAGSCGCRLLDLAGCRRARRCPFSRRTLGGHVLLRRHCPQERCQHVSGAHHPGVPTTDEIG